MIGIFRHRFFFVFVLLGLVILVFIAYPLLKTIFSSDAGGLWDTLLDKGVRDVILLTLYAALIATIAGLLFGVPLAYVLARRNFPGKKLIEAIIDVPIVVPHTAAGIALLFAFGEQSLLGKAFHALHVDFVGTVAGIVIAMMFVSIPFLVDSAREGFKSVDPRLEKVARTLGASQRKTFFGISLPLAWRSILSGSALMWARGISEFGAVVILAYHPMIAPVLVYHRFESYGLEWSRPVAVLVVLISIIVFIILRFIAQWGEKS